MIMFTLISCVMIVIILYTYYYLQEISQCPCFIANKKKELNVDYMKFYLLLDLVSLLLFMFLFYNKIQKGGKSNKTSLTENVWLLASLCLILFIHSYMTYNVYHFYNSVKTYCECVNQWQKYFVYYEGVFSGIVSLQYIFTLFLVILIMINQ
ncbi:hypothetical protein 162322288 [Organic Lake phycodnavirus 1]|jgi:hypothetical protein|nr:hypothetical protein 162322288 [Organic Lake phycodnavirus 1]